MLALGMAGRSASWCESVQGVGGRVGLPSVGLAAAALRVPGPDTSPLACVAACRCRVPEPPGPASNSRDLPTAA